MAGRYRWRKEVDLAGVILPFFAIYFAATNHFTTAIIFAALSGVVEAKVTFK